LTPSGLFHLTNIRNFEILIWEVVLKFEILGIVLMSSNSSWPALQLLHVGTNVGIQMDAHEISIPAKLYLKKSSRTYEKTTFNTLEVIDITVDESKRQMGNFNAILNILLEHCQVHQMCLVFDVVLNDFLVAALKRKGFIQIQTDPVVTLVRPPAPLTKDK